MSLLSCAYTHQMAFAPLLTSTHNSNPVADSKVRRPQSCSPRSMYSLATAVGISCRYITPSINTLKSLGSKMSRSVHWRTSDRNSLPLTLCKNSFLLLLRGGCPTVLFVHFFPTFTPPVTKRSWIWKSNSSAKTLLKRIPNR